MPPRAGRGIGAFTLIELLVVIAVISLLMGMLSPVVRAVRRQAKLTACLHTVGQIGHTVPAYAEEYRGYLPPWRAICYCDPHHESMYDGWWLTTHYLVQEYLNREAEDVWQCPADNMTDGNGGAPADCTNAYLRDRRKCGYLYNHGGGSQSSRMWGRTDEGLACQIRNEQRTLDWVANPSKKIAAFCWSAHNFCLAIDMQNYWHSRYPRIIAPLVFVDAHAAVCRIHYGPTATADYQW